MAKRRILITDPNTCNFRIGDYHPIGIRAVDFSPVALNKRFWNPRRVRIRTHIYLSNYKESVGKNGLRWGFVSLMLSNRSRKNRLESSSQTLRPQRLVKPRISGFVAIGQACARAEKWCNASACCQQKQFDSVRDMELLWSLIRQLLVFHCPHPHHSVYIITPNFRKCQTLSLPLTT
jgi:hypothetical protein